MSQPDLIMLCPEIDEATYVRLRDFVLVDPSRSIDSVVREALLLLMGPSKAVSNA